MKHGRTLTEFAMELDRRREAKKDYLLDTRNLVMDCDEHNTIVSMENPSTRTVTALQVNEVAHNQIGSYLNIPSRYYDKMRHENPELLAQNVNSWFRKYPKVRMVRALDGTMRAFLSDRYRRIDNFEIAQVVLPVIGDMPDATIESCEITDEQMYIKVVNPRLTAEVTPGDVVQSGLIITNSEVGLGSMTIQPLIYRLVCTNGMVVNDAATRKYHTGRGNIAGEDFTLYSDETLKADDYALLLKVKDTVKAVVEQTRFDKVVAMMRDAKNARITSPDIPAMVELASTDYGFSKNEGESVLNYLIRGGDLSLYGLANSVTRAAQDVESYDRSTAMESIGYSILGMSKAKWDRLNKAERQAA